MSEAVDPIEKKPFFHFLPGTLACSIATAGCNLHCRFCQNWEISQWPHGHAGPPPGHPVTPAGIAAAAPAARCPSTACTCTEPTVFMELALATCRLAAEAGLRHVYPGNVPGDAREDTRCPGCERPVVRRRGFAVLEDRLAMGRCPVCGTALAGVWA